MNSITNLVSYVNGIKVVHSDDATVTLENGKTVAKNQCRFVSFDAVDNVTYYRYEEL